MSARLQCGQASILLPRTFRFQPGALCNLYQLGKPVVKPVEIAVPAGAGYVLTSAKSGRSLAIVDLEWIQRELFRQVPTQDSRLAVMLFCSSTVKIVISFSLRAALCAVTTLVTRNCLKGKTIVRQIDDDEGLSMRNSRDY